MRTNRPLSLGLLLALGACAHHPPAGFAPDPALLPRIQHLEMATEPTACPGTELSAGYAAVLDDGSRLTFAAGYDEHHPPPLHVAFLVRTSPQARPLANGGWATEHDPLLSTGGFALHASLPGAKATIDTVIPPDYSCLPHELRFEGGEGADGPDVTIRIAQGRSLFFPQLLIAAIEVRGAPTRFVLADASRIPPRGWLVVESAGGHGSRGANGRAGHDGGVGAGCSNGIDGAAGMPGGDGGPAGRGGHVVIIAPDENPFLAGVVDARVPGGHGGEGGHGGHGGRGGPGGPGSSTCAAGHQGADGVAGPNGSAGPDGRQGGRPQVLTVPNKNVFGANPRPELLRLLETPTAERN